MVTHSCQDFSTFTEVNNTWVWDFCMYGVLFRLTALPDLILWTAEVNSLGIKTSSVPSLISCFSSSSSSSESIRSVSGIISALVTRHTQCVTINEKSSNFISTHCYSCSFQSFEINCLLSQKKGIGPAKDLHQLSKYSHSEWMKEGNQE